MTTRAEEIAAEGPYRVEKSSSVYVIMGPQGRWPFHFSHESTAKVRADDFNKVYKQGQQDRWIPIAEAPKNGSIVTVGHVAGWIEPDILFRDGHFYKRVNHLTGGDAGFKQKDWKKPDGNPASPDEWPWGPELFPTHYQPLPPNPEQR